MVTSTRNHPLIKRASQNRDASEMPAARVTRAGSSALSLDRRLLGSALCVIGSAIAFLVGWIGMARETAVSRQMPYLASAGGTGIVLVVVALALYLDYEHAADRVGIRLVLERLDAVEQTVAQVAVQVGVANSTREAGAGVRDAAAAVRGAP